VGHTLGTHGPHVRWLWSPNSHCSLACPALRVFATEDNEGVYYCRACAPPDSRNEKGHTPAAALKQPAFPARSISDPHTPIGTRVDAQDAIAQRLQERTAARDVSMGESSGSTSTLTPESAGPASTPYRIPKATPPPKEAAPHRRSSVSQHQPHCDALSRTVPVDEAITSSADAGRSSRRAPRLQLALFWSASQWLMLAHRRPSI
jgi:hypothetical protein